MVKHKGPFQSSEYIPDENEHICYTLRTIWIKWTTSKTKINHNSYSNESTWAAIEEGITKKHDTPQRAVNTYTNSKSHYQVTITSEGDKVNNGDNKSSEDVESHSLKQQGSWLMRHKNKLKNILEEDLIETIITMEANSSMQMNINTLKLFSIVGFWDIKLLLQIVQEKNGFFVREELQINILQSNWSIMIEEKKFWSLYYMQPALPTLEGIYGRL